MANDEGRLTFVSGITVFTVIPEHRRRHLSKVTSDEGQAWIKITHFLVYAKMNWTVRVQ